MSLFGDERDDPLLMDLWADRLMRAKLTLPGQGLWSVMSLGHVSKQEALFNGRAVGFEVSQLQTDDDAINVNQGCAYFPNTVPSLVAWTLVSGLSGTKRSIWGAISPHSTLLSHPSTVSPTWPSGHWNIGLLLIELTPVWLYTIILFRQACHFTGTSNFILHNLEWISEISKMVSVKMSLHLLGIHQWDTWDCFGFETAVQYSYCECYQYVQLWNSWYTCW